MRKALLGFVFLCLVPAVSSAAIAFDAASTGSGTGAPVTWSHTVTGANPILWVSITSNNASGDIVTGVTYNGSSMTRAIAVKSAANNNFSYLYYLYGPATGANTVSISHTGSSGDVAGNSVSYTGAAQSGVPLTAFATGSATGYTTSTTTPANGYWTVGNCGIQRTCTASTNTTQRADQEGLGSLITFDTNGTQLTAGTQSLATTFSSISQEQISAAFAPFASASAYVPNTQICVAGYCFYQ